MKRLAFALSFCFLFSYLGFAICDINIYPPNHQCAPKFTEAFASSCPAPDPSAPNPWTDPEIDGIPIDSPEHLRRKAIMFRENAFLAQLIKKNEPQKHICWGPILANTTVLLYKDCPWRQYIDNGGLALRYRCYERSQTDGKVIDEYTWRQTGVYGVSIDRPDGDEGRVVNSLLIEGFDGECEIFYYYEAIRGKASF